MVGGWLVSGGEIDALGIGTGGVELGTDCEYTLNPDMSISVNVYPVLIPALASVSTINLFKSL